MSGYYDKENFSMKLILASASPRRRELLGHLGIPFEIISKSIPEESHHQEPVEFCRDIALQKGQAVAQDFLHKENSLIISADTIVCLDQKIYGKPVNREEARLFLTELAGKTHSVYTAVGMHLIDSGKIKTSSFVEESKVTFNAIPHHLMELYLKTGDSLDKAGAYGIQGPSLTFISKVEGDYANVVGFPLSRFIIECENFLGKESWLELF
jgi:septum formation protein